MTKEELIDSIRELRYSMRSFRKFYDDAIDKISKALDDMSDSIDDLPQDVDEIENTKEEHEEEKPGISQE
jgi:prefoldin subunit 5